MAELVSLKEVKKVYSNGKEAVKSISLELSRGEIFGLLGPNGAGKTTTINMITGALKPTSGSILFGEEDLLQAKGEKTRELKRRIGYSPERPALFQRLTPVEFLTFVGELYGMEEEVLRERIERYLDLFLLQDKQNEYMEKLSAGMHKKITTIMAILGDPDLILLDEPFTDLDPASIYRFKELILDLKEEGKAILISTHFLVLASQISDRLGIINQGELLFSGSESELRDRLQKPEETSLEDLFLRLTTLQEQGRGISL